MTMSTVVQLLRDLIRIPSLSQEEDAIASFLQAYAGSRGFQAERTENNVWFRLGDGPRRLLLNSHLDVVPPSSDHPYEPFEPVVAEGCIYGRGAVDAKASVAAMTTAVLELAEEGYQPEDGCVLTALTACEEVHPEYNGLRRLRPQLPEIHAALVGEPTDMRPVVAQKGLLVLRATARGRSAHAARAERGENAILNATRDIRLLEELDFEREHPVLGRISLAVTMIRGGTARNVIPDTCTVDIDIRTTPAYTHGEITEMVQERLESTVEVHSARILPLSTPADESIVRACLEAIPGATLQGSPTASDWLYLADVPTVKIGPGSSELSHTARERIAIAALEDAVSAYKRIIRAYFRRASG